MKMKQEILLRVVLKKFSFYTYQIIFYELLTYGTVSFFSCSASLICLPFMSAFLVSYVTDFFYVQLQ